jgi:hypothetical protein
MDDDERICPLCCEELDLSDQNFLPCKCGYQVCMWCWHHIKENLSTGRCLFELLIDCSGFDPLFPFEDDDDDDDDDTLVLIVWVVRRGRCF